MQAIAGERWQTVFTEFKKYFMGAVLRHFHGVQIFGHVTRDDTSTLSEIAVDGMLRNGIRCDVLNKFTITRSPSQSYYMHVFIGDAVKF